MSISIKMGTSGTIKSAQSKKCNLLKAVRLQQTGPLKAKQILKADPLLQKYLTNEEIDAAAKGEYVAKAAKNSVVVEISQAEFDAIEAEEKALKAAAKAKAAKVEAKS